VSAELAQKGRGAVREWPALPAQKIQTLFVPGKEIAGVEQVLTLRADQPLPTNFVFARTGTTDMFEFDMQRGRRLSTDSWFGEGFRVLHPTFRYHLALVPGTGHMQLPTVEVPGLKKIYVAMEWYGRPLHNGSATLEIFGGDNQLLEQTIDLNQIQALSRFEVAIADAGALSFKLSGVDNPEYLLYLMRLKFRYIYD
jgi:hypothetical protein